VSIPVTSSQMEILPDSGERTRPRNEEWRENTKPTEFADGLDALDSLYPNNLKDKAYSIGAHHSYASSDDTPAVVLAPQFESTNWRLPAKSARHFLDQRGPPGTQQQRTPMWRTATKSMADEDAKAETVNQQRIFERDLPFYQSSGSVHVNFTFIDRDRAMIWEQRALRAHDWFDTFAAVNTGALMLAIFLLYTVGVLAWAGLYIGVSAACNDPEVGVMTFQTAFAFSLETSTTVGYGLPVANGIFFDGCGGWLVAIYFQQMLTMLLNAVVTGFVILRIQRADRRADQVIFSSKCAIVCIRGRFYLTCQVVDLLGKRPVVGAKVKAFAILHDLGKASLAFWQVRAMRLIRPDDEIGANVWLSVPCVVVHEIDPSSPLASSLITKPPHHAASAIPNQFPQPPQRTVDGRVGSRNQAVCLVCGQSFMNEAALRRHVVFQAEDELSRDRAEDFGHRAIKPADVSRPVVIRNSEAMERLAVTGDTFKTVTPEEMMDSIKVRCRAAIVVVVFVAVADLLAPLATGTHSRNQDGDLLLGRGRRPAHEQQLSGAPLVHRGGDCIQQATRAVHGRWTQRQGGNQPVAFSPLCRRRGQCRGPDSVCESFVMHIPSV